MSDIAVPSTPAPEAEAGLCDAGETTSAHAKLRSHSPNMPDELTPPPSSQIPTTTAMVTYITSSGKNKNLFTSPPDTIKSGPPVGLAGLFGEVPSMDMVQNYDEDQLRSLVAQILPALGEARLSAAHSKLQHSLLAIENAESIKRAEVEHEMTRREVQVLQECSHARNGIASHINSPGSPASSSQPHLELALKHCHQLQAENVLLERRLRQAKKLILHLDGRNADLEEDTQRLRQRIKQNRDHLDAMRLSGAISVNNTPLADFSTPSHNDVVPRTPQTAQTSLNIKTKGGSQDAFDALLFAGQVLNEETNSVASTPSHARPKKPSTNHLRGAHSLSSLPATPGRSRPATADDVLFTPINRSAAQQRPSFSAPITRLTYEEVRRDERDSTISASDNEEQAETCADMDVPASQASRRAAEMLRRGPAQESDGIIQSIGASNKKLMQVKTAGQLRKSGSEKSKIPKREGAPDIYEKLAKISKKAKAGDSFPESVGLGIAGWPNQSP